MPSRRRLRVLAAIRSVVDRLRGRRRDGQSHSRLRSTRRHDGDAPFPRDAFPAGGNVHKAVPTGSPLRDSLTNAAHTAADEDGAVAGGAEGSVSTDSDSTPDRADVGFGLTRAGLPGADSLSRPAGTRAPEGPTPDTHDTDAPTADTRETTGPFRQGTPIESLVGSDEAAPECIDDEPASGASIDTDEPPGVEWAGTAEDAPSSVSRDAPQDSTGAHDHRSAEARQAEEALRQDNSLVRVGEELLDVSVEVAGPEPDAEVISQVDAVPDHVEQEAADRDSGSHPREQLPIASSTDSDRDSTSSDFERTTTDGQGPIDPSTGVRDAGTDRGGRRRGSSFHRERPPTPTRVDLPSEYLLWNRVLTEYCLLETTPATDRAYLCITPRILAAALEAGGGTRLSPEDATWQFQSAISEVYEASVLASRIGLWNLSGDAEDGSPACVGILAASVLAAYRMRSDEEAGPNAYYTRLAEILGCDLVGGRPRGFDLELFADLWEALAERLQTVSDRTLARPAGEPGLRRFVAYPLCHVPLRQLDVEKLPEFFDWARLEPGSRVGSSEVSAALGRWATGRGVLSRAGEQAINDERREAVAAQVALELEAWDGSSRDTGGRRTATVHLMLDFVRRRPHLEFLARRPSSFPASFDAGARQLEAGEQGWYDPVPVVPEDGEALKAGFAWTCSGPDGGFTLHRPPSDVVPLRPAADFSGYLSQRGLPLGLTSAVLCTADCEAGVSEYLTAATGVRCDAIDDPHLPTGWRLFTPVRPSRRVPVPPGLEQLEVHVDASIVLQGGLRVGRRSAWLAGAPPSILVGGCKASQVVIDSARAPVVGGELRPAAPLGVGVHVVEAERARRRFEIVEPEGRWEETPALAAHDSVAVALPSGDWSVVGAKIGSVARARGYPRFAVVAFEPVWAIASTARRAPVVIALGRELPYPPKVTPQDAGDPRSRAWAHAVYEAQIRRPRFATRDATVDPHDVLDAWRKYAATARQLKRYWRRAR